MKKFLKILLKLLLWLVSILAILYIVTLSYCSYEVGYKPYRGLKFDKKIWSGESKLKIDQSGNSSSSKMFSSVYGTNVQCKMYHDIVTNILKKGMHINEIEDLLGKKENEILIYCKDEKTKCIRYSLGTCYASSLTISHGSLNICFNRNQQALGYGQDDYLKKTCKEKFSCFKDKCDCEKIEEMKHGGISITPIECPFEIDKW